MSMAGLRYCSSSPTGPLETKSGAYVYSGDPSHFHEWQFRTLLRVELCKKKMEQKAKEKAKDEEMLKKKKLLLKYRPNPHQVNMRWVMGGFATPRSHHEDDDFVKDLGLNALMDAGPPTDWNCWWRKSRSMCFLWGHMKQGSFSGLDSRPMAPISRQSAETILSFIGRRKRWWIQLKELDPEMTISTQMRAELLLETSGLTRQEQLMVKTACPKPKLRRDTVRSYWNTMEESIWGIQGAWPLLQGPFRRKEQERTKERGGIDRVTLQVTMMAKQEMKQQAKETTTTGTRTMVKEPMLGMVVSPVQKTQMIATVCQMKNLGMALTAMAACDMDETSTDGLEELGEACQHQLQAYAAVGRAKGKGPYKGSGKGKHKGKGKGKRVVKTQLSIKGRKVSLASLKKNSRCLRCGGYGHWAGDPECKMPNKKPSATASVPGQVLSQGKVGYFALSDSSGEDDGPLPCMVIGAGSSKKKCRYMGYRPPLRTLPKPRQGRHHVHPPQPVMVAECLPFVPGGRTLWLTRHCPLEVTMFSRLGSIRVSPTMKCCNNTLGTMFGDEMNLEREESWISSWIGSTCTMMLIMQPIKLPLM